MLRAKKSFIRAATDRVPAAGGVSPALPEGLQAAHRGPKFIKLFTVVIYKCF
jgi:hypothetical protein